MKEKFDKLVELMEKYDIFQQDDEVGLALKELETEINSLNTFTLYREDFGGSSEENKVLFKEGTLDKVDIIYKVK